jgi:excisionase family DNA binding protein
MIHFKKRKFLTLAEAAEYLGLQKSTLYSYCKQRLIRFYKVRNRRNYFLKEDLDNFIINESNLVKSQSQIDEEAEQHLQKSKQREEK